MAKKLIFLSAIVLSLLIISFESQANVIVEDADSATEVNENPSFTSADVPTGSGLIGDYQLIACGVSSDNGNIFPDPVPGTWTELDQGPCGGTGICSHGIWGRFTDNPASEDITCEWTIPTFVFGAGSFRYNEVDPIDPIIAVACNTGAGIGTNVMATAPSLNTIAGSQVARIFTFSNLEILGTSDNNANDFEDGEFQSIAAVSSVNVIVAGVTNLVFSRRTYWRIAT